MHELGRVAGRGGGGAFWRGGGGAAGLAISPSMLIAAPATPTLAMENYRLRHTRAMVANFYKKRLYQHQLVNGPEIKGDLYLNIFGSTFPDDKLYFQIFIFTLQLQFTAESELSARLRSPFHRNTQTNATDHDMNNGKT